MISMMEEKDLDQVAAVWLSGNKEAHPFVPKQYWEENLPKVKKQFLQAEIFVYEEEQAVRGFAGLQGDYLAGIFVEQKFRSRGIGKRLLDEVKKTHPKLTLHVYRKNKGAAAFYEREGFRIAGEGVDEATGEVEYTMSYTRK